MLNHNENENENEKNSHRYDIDTGLGNDTNIINAKSSSVWWCLHVCQAQFMKKLRNTEAELKNSIAYKKNMYLEKTRKFQDKSFRWLQKFRTADFLNEHVL